MLRKHGFSTVAFLVTTLLVAWILATNTSVSHAQRVKETSRKFDFGPGKVAPGYTPVLPTTVYSKELGYGFEPGTNISCLDRGGKDALFRVIRWIVLDAGA